MTNVPTSVETSEFPIFETLMYHFLFGIHYMYINAFSIFICQCLYLMLLLYMFKILKKNKYILYFLMFSVIFPNLPIFSPMFLRSCIQDPCRYFAGADFFNYDFQFDSLSSFMFIASFICSFLDDIYLIHRSSLISMRSMHNRNAFFLTEKQNTYTYGSQFRN